MSSSSFDNTLLSPVLDALPAPWEVPTSLNINDSFTHYFAPTNTATTETSLATTPALKTDSLQAAQQLCIPPAQVFSIPTDQNAPSPIVAAAPAPKQERERLSISLNPSAVAAATAAAAKRSASPPPTATVKRQRTTERVNSKDFIPPDVTGLSKREARLVKNRAAAFLSRQRKREEFELMEVRVTELEQENARLLALAQAGGVVAPAAPSSSQETEELVSQIEQLKADLAASEERERHLSAQLLERASEAPSFQQQPEPQMKVEQLEPAALSQALDSRPATGKSAASLGLMVLLCALPTLLSMPNAIRSSLPTSYEPFSTASSSGFDFNSILTSDYDWNSLNPASSLMDLDNDLDFTNPFAADDSADAASPSPVQADSSITTPQKLEFSASDLPEELIAAADSDLNGLSLAGLDISFDAKPEDGKIRVRIHTSGSVASTSVNSRASSPGLTEDSSLESTHFESSQSFKDIPSLAHFASALPSPSASALGDPFLGIGSSPDEDLSDFSSSYFNSRSSGDSMMFDDFGTGSEYSYSGSNTGKDLTKKRVRIALKSMPSAGGEGGEWEVQVC